METDSIIVHHRLLLRAWYYLLAAIYLLSRFDLCPLYLSRVLQLLLVLLLMLMLLLLVFLLLYYVLEESMASVPCNCHMAVLFKLGVVALCFFRNAVAE